MIALIFVLIILNMPLYKYVFKKIFISKEDFQEAVKFTLTPDIFSLFKGRYFSDRIGEYKIGMFIFICCLTIFLEYSILDMIFKF